MSYAKGTQVSIDKTKVELDRLLQKYGAGQRMIGADETRNIAFIVFAMEKRQVRLKIPLPDPKARVYTHDHRSYLRSESGAREVWEQACRERWRCVLLLVKAKLELVQLGASTFEREFLADIFLPDGRTVHEALAEQIESSYLDGHMPPLLGSGGQA